MMEYSSLCSLMGTSQEELFPARDFPDRFLNKHNLSHKIYTDLKIT